LQEANLQGANLQGAKYHNTSIIGTTAYMASGLGSTNRCTVGIPLQECILILCGCWAGTLDEFRARILKVYSDMPIYKEYALMADMFEARWNREKNNCPL
jgi:uncharacterized protein YjbI with pentapeptide repeats